MDGWTYPCADVYSPSTQVAHLDQRGHASGSRRHLAHWAEASRRAAALEGTEALGEALAISEISPSRAAPSCGAISF